LANTKPCLNEYGFPDDLTSISPDDPLSLDPPLVGDLTSFSLPEDVIAKLAARFGVTETVQRQKLADQLKIIADTHREALEMGKITPSIGESNAAVEAILKCVRALNKKFLSVDFTSEDHFIKVMADNPYIKEKGLPQKSGRAQYVELRSRLEHFERHLGPYLEEAKNQSGRPENTILKSTISTLINLYEEFSGQSFTHTGHVKGEYTQDPQSEGGQFVLAVLKHIDKKITPGNVSSILSERIRVRNRQ